MPKQQCETCFTIILNFGDLVIKIHPIIIFALLVFLFPLVSGVVSQSLVFCPKAIVIFRATLHRRFLHNNQPKNLKHENMKPHSVAKIFCNSNISLYQNFVPKSMATDGSRNIAPSFSQKQSSWIGGQDPIQR